MPSRTFVTLTLAALVGCSSGNSSNESGDASAPGFDGAPDEAGQTVDSGADFDAAVLPDGASSREGGGADSGGHGTADSGTVIKDAGGPPEGDACSEDGEAPGTSHEPAGMSAQLDTGPLTVSPAATGTWTNGNVTFSM